jgi:hypothetical protein
MPVRCVAFLTVIWYANACVTWETADGKTKPAGMLLPGLQSGTKEGFCRFISMNTVPLGVEIGKTEGVSTCYGTVQGPGFAPHENGTVTKHYEVAVAQSSCTVSYPKWSQGTAFPTNIVVGGFRSTGESLGLCLAPGGEGAGSSIPGKVFITGPRQGQCCWSAGFKEHCMTQGYLLATFSTAPTLPPTPGPTPTPRPPVPPEPTPPLLELNGRIFAAYLSYGGSADTMGLTFATPNSTSPSYKPVVLWSESLAPGSTWSDATCLSSPPGRECYTKSPILHYCNLTGLVYEIFLASR